MRILITLFALTTSVCSMDDTEFENFFETLTDKYGLQTVGGGGVGLHSRETCIGDYKSSIRIWYKRPYDYGHKKIGPYKQLGIRFSGEYPSQIKSALSPLQENVVGFFGFHIPCEAYKSWIVCFTDELEKLEASVHSLKIIWTNNLIPNSLYDFFLDELGIDDPRLNDIPSFIKKIAQGLPEDPTFMDFKEATNKELLEIRRPLVRDKLFNTINEEIKTNCFGFTLEENPLPQLPFPDEAFLDYLMSDYYMEALRENLSLLQRRIYFISPIDATGEKLKEITLKELGLILDKTARERMTFRLIEDLSSTGPTPSYLVDLCNLIKKDSPYFQKVLKIKGDLNFGSEAEMNKKERYGPIIESCLLSGNRADQNTFIQKFISNEGLGGELPEDLNNLDLSFDSLMRMLDHIRKQNIVIMDKK